MLAVSIDFVNHVAFAFDVNSAAKSLWRNAWLDVW